MATDPNAAGVKTPAQVIAEKGPEFVLGLDTSRQWATGMQAFVNPDFSLLVFREQTMMQGEDGSSEVMVKNIGSFVVPTTVLREFHALLTSSFAGERRGQDGQS